MITHSGCGASSRNLTFTFFDMSVYVESKADNMQGGHSEWDKSNSAVVHALESGRSTEIVIWQFCNL